MTATFMPKPFTDRTGTGLHLHLSLWRGGARRSSPTATTRRPRPRPLAARLLVHRRAPRARPALQAVLAPTVNSYKRTGATSTRSGATWSPRQATYGGNDRTHFIRVPDGNRDRAARRRRLGQPLPRHRRVARRRPGRRSTADLDPGDPGSDRAATRRCRRRCCTPSTRSTADPVVSGALDAAARASASTSPTLKHEEFLELAQPGQRLGGRPLPDRLLTARRLTERNDAMCGIVGLHLRDPGCTPGSAACWPPCSCQDRRPRPRLRRRRRLRRPGAGAPTGHAAVSRARRRPADLADVPPALLPGRPRRAGHGGGRHHGRRSAGRGRRPRRRGPRRPRPVALVIGTGEDRDGLQGRRAPAGARRRPTGSPRRRAGRALAHTRMATESAVTPAGCHPFSVGADQCLVHNGSFANHATIRRELQAPGGGVRLGQRLRGRRPVRRRPAGAGRRPRQGAPAALRAFRRLLHAARHQRRQLRRGPRRHRLQARDHRRDARLGRHGVGVPRPGAAARHRVAPASSSRSRRGSTHGSGEHPSTHSPLPRRASSTSPAARSGRSTRSCTPPAQAPTRCCAPTARTRSRPGCGIR